MKKKLISLITMSMLLLTGCRKASSSIPDSVDDRDTRIIEVYDAYKANGGTLDYDTWLSSIKGEKGDKGDTGDKEKKAIREIPEKQEKVSLPSSRAELLVMELPIPSSIRMVLHPHLL